MRFQRIRNFCQTLRFRLTLWNTAIVLVIMLVNLVAIRAGLELTIYQMVDEFLTEELNASASDLNRLSEQPDQLHARFNRQAMSHPRRRLFIQLLDNHGTLAWASEQSPPLNVLPSNARTFGVPATVDGHRVICRQVRLPSREALTLCVGCSLARAHWEIHRFTRMLVGVTILLLLIAPAGGYLLARQATRPIARIIHTTARLETTHLAERLPVRGTRDELDQLSQTINNFLDRIASYLCQSREFIANAAHELRSPLTALQSSLEVALNVDRSIEEYKDVLSVLLEECHHMGVLVNQLLLLAEGDAGRLRLCPQALRLDQIIANSREMFQVVAETNEVELTIRRLEPVLIHGDGNRLWQVVNNLLDNAIKFTPAHGQVSLDFWLDEARRQCVLEVTDTGAGIAPHDLPHVFERFYQSDKARQRENPSRGVGLGLSICQAVVAAHGGAIEVASTLGIGTTFTVRLPDCTRPDAVETPLAPPSRRRGMESERLSESA